MNHSLNHLPSSKQQDLSHIVAILRNEIEQVTAFSTGKKKHSRLLKIILFGSHATGKWVNNPAHGYVSDYDILVILNNDDLVQEYKIWHSAEDRIALKVRPPLNILVHSLNEVNGALSQGQYFFSDIKREGIVLFEADNRELAASKNVNAEEAKQIAEKHYRQWFESAKEFFLDYQAPYERGNYKNAAFLLHQVAERLYSCLLLVLTNYKPYTHNLKQLNALAILQDARFADIFPQDSKIERRRFMLLKDAYVDARYSEHYAITQEELEWLASRVQLLQQLTDECCQTAMAKD